MKNQHDALAGISTKGNIFVKLSFYGKGNGGTELLDQIRGGLDDKNIGLAILQRVLERFSITSQDVENMVFKDMQEAREVPNKKIIWTRY